MNQALLVFSNLYIAKMGSASTYLLIFSKHLPKKEYNISVMSVSSWVASGRTSMHSGSSVVFCWLRNQKKRKTFFSHTAGSLGLSVRGVSGHVSS